MQGWQVKVMIYRVGSYRVITRTVLRDRAKPHRVCWYIVLTRRVGGIRRNERLVGTDQ